MVSLKESVKEAHSGCDAVSEPDLDKWAEDYIRKLEKYMEKQIVVTQPVSENRTEEHRLMEIGECRLALSYVVRFLRGT